MAPTPPPTGGGALARNVLWNTAGQAIPLVAALGMVPVLVDGLGVERFGVLTLAWAVVGYFGLFDFGLGRATTHFVATHTAAGAADRLPSLVWGSIWVLTGIGVVLGTVAAAVTAPLVDGVLNISPGLRGETRGAFYILAAALPVILATAGARGTLEGQQRFRVVNAVKLPANLLLFASPLVVLPFSHSLVPVVGILVGSRLVVLAIYLAYCVRSVPLPRARTLRELMPSEVLRFGGWSALTNILGSLMVNGYVDRLLVGSLLSVTAVAYYATPFDVVARFWIVPVALLGVLFPAFSAMAVTSEARLRDLYWRGVKYVLLALAPVTVAIVALAQPALELWLGDRFADESTEVLQLLAIGMLMTSLGQVPFAALQALGRPDLTAKRHAIQLPFYIAAVAGAVELGGIVGAACAWATWTVVDTVWLFWLLRGVAPKLAALPAQFAMAAGIVPALLAAYGVSSVGGPVERLVMVVVCVPVFIVLTWRYLLDDRERQWIVRARGGGR